MGNKGILAKINIVSNTGIHIWGNNENNKKIKCRINKSPSNTDIYTGK
jgi:hypothetical protein